MATQILGFSQQNLVARSQVVQAFERVPRQHRRGIHLIRYDPHKLIAQTINQFSDQSIGHSVKGSYYTSEDLKAVVIWRFHRVEEFYHILYHEVGHHVFHKYLQQSERDEWLYGVRKRELTTVSDYACTNAREDFSECYAYKLQGLRELALCPERAAYFDQYVFKSSA
tara:strand:+ start:344 stop:847 length:504 start_codon:yes stop_codon:yes gene_type:complete